MKMFLVLVGAMAVCGCASESVCMLELSGEPISCIEYSDRIPESDAEASCEDGGGTWEAAPCDAATAVGSCQSFGSTAWYYQGYLDAFNLTLTDVEEGCEEAAGEFIPGATE